MQQPLESIPHDNQPRQNSLDEPPWSPELINEITQLGQLWVCHDQDDAELLLRPDAGDLPALCVPLHRLNLLTPELVTPLRTIFVIQRGDDGPGDGFYARYGVKVKQQLEAVVDGTKTLYRIPLNEIAPTMPRLWSLMQEDAHRFQQELTNFRMGGIAEEISPKRPPQRTKEARPSEWPEPSPLPDALPPVAAFEPRLLPEAIRPWIEDIAERRQCPADFPAVSAMVALGTVVGRRVGIRPKRRDNWHVVPNLWGGVVGRPGIMKTPAIVEGVRPLWRLEKDAKDRYDDALEAWKAGELVTEERKKVVSGEIREALRAKLTEKAQKLAADLMASTISQSVRGRYIVNDSTIEKLRELLNENPNGLLVFRDELTGLLRTRDREDHASARAFYLEAWNGTNRFTYDRIGRGTIDIEAACLSILGCIQPGPLSHYLRAVLEGEHGDDGLIQRFQLLVWPDVAGEWNNVDH